MPGIDARLTVGHMQRLHAVDWPSRRQRQTGRKTRRGVGKIRRHASFSGRWTGPYVVAVGNGDGAPDDWSRYLRQVTSRPGWSVARLAREAGLNRSTIFEWIREGGDKLTMASVHAVARALGDTTGETLRAAGGMLESGEPEDPAIAEILVSGLPPDIQERLIQTVLNEREADERRRLERLRETIAIVKGEAG